MRLNPNANLSPGTVAAIEDILSPPPSIPVPSERALRRFSLGIATHQEQEACLGALIRSGTLRSKLIAMRRGSGAFIEEHVAFADRIYRLIAEGRSSEALSDLKSCLSDLRNAWEGASAFGNDQAIEAMVGSLSGPLMESGAEEELTSLAEAAFVAAERLGRPMLRARMLSMLAVFASRRGDAAEAHRLWSERLAIALKVGEYAVAADALLDLGGLAFENSDYDECLRLADQAEPLATRAARPDVLATVWTHRAEVALRRGNLDAAAELAQRALQTLTGTDGMDMGLFVRIGSVRVLLACGWPWTALNEAVNVLSFSIEGGRKGHAGLSLGLMGSAFAQVGEIELAERSLALALDIHRELGNRHVEKAERALAEFRSETSLPNRDRPHLSNWTEDAAAILARALEIQDKTSVAR